MPHLQAEVPQEVEELVGEALDERRELAVVDHHEVDVRRRVQLAAPEAPERDEHVRRGGEAVGGRVGGDQRGEGVQDLLDEARMGLDDLLARRAFRVHHLEGIEALGERGPEELEAEAASILGALGAGLGAARPAIQRGRHGWL